MDSVPDVFIPFQQVADIIWQNIDNAEDVENVYQKLLPFINSKQVSVEFVLTTIDRRAMVDFHHVKVLVELHKKFNTDINSFEGWSEPLDFDEDLTQDEFSENEFSKKLRNVLKNDNIAEFIEHQRYDYSESLVMATEYGSERCLEYMLNNNYHKKFNMNAVIPSYLDTMNQNALFSGNKNVIKLLADYDLISKNALKFAVAIHSDDIFNWMVESCDVDDVPINYCMFFSNFRAAAYFIKKGCVWSETSDAWPIYYNNEQTALYIAVHMGSLEAVKFIHENSRQDIDSESTIYYNGRIHF